MNIQRTTSILRSFKASSLQKQYKFNSTLSPKTGILMLNMGGPQRQEDIHQFLLNLFTDKDIIPLPFQNKLGPWIAKRRTPSIKEKYQEIGGGSPIYKWTNLQGQLLCQELDKVRPQSAPHKHYVGFRYTNPLTEDALDQMERDGVQHCIAFSQYPQYCCSTTGSSMNAIHKHYLNRGVDTKMNWSVIDRWHTNPHLISCFAENIKQEIETFPVEKRDAITLLFSSHSIPMGQVGRGDPYPAEVGATVTMVMKELNLNLPHRLVWQSKVGPQPWLVPSTDAAIKGLVKRGRKNIILVPIAFTSDHIETLHELDIEYAQELGRQVGAEKIGRCAAPNAHPLFVKALVHEVVSHLDAAVACSRQFLDTCPLCVNASCHASKKWFANLTTSPGR